MTTHFLVRTGAWGEIGQFRTADGVCYQRRQRVICKTPRGLEIGEVVAETGVGIEVTGKILRPMGEEDRMLQMRLEKYKVRAVEDCRRQIAEAGLKATLLEVEQLFDGRTLVFHFLGDATPELEAITDELADAYERNVRSRHFAKLLAEGCGPNCGTADADGCSGGCAVCVVASACSAQAVS